MTFLKTFELNFSQIKINDKVIGTKEDFMNYIEHTGYTGTGYPTP